MFRSLWNAVVGSPKPIATNRPLQPSDGAGSTVQAQPPPTGWQATGAQKPPSAQGPAADPQLQPFEDAIRQLNVRHAQERVKSTLGTKLLENLPIVGGSGRAAGETTDQVIAATNALYQTLRQKPSVTPRELEGLKSSIQQANLQLDDYAKVRGAVVDVAKDAATNTGVAIAGLATAGAAIPVMAGTSVLVGASARMTAGTALDVRADGSGVTLGGQLADGAVGGLTGGASAAGTVAFNGIAKALSTQAKAVVPPAANAVTPAATTTVKPTLLQTVRELAGKQSLTGPETARLADGLAQLDPARLARVSQATVGDVFNEGEHALNAFQLARSLMANGTLPQLEQALANAGPLPAFSRAAFDQALAAYRAAPTGRGLGEIAKTLQGLTRDQLDSVASRAAGGPIEHASRNDLIWETLTHVESTGAWDALTAAIP